MKLRLWLAAFLSVLPVCAAFTAPRTITKTGIRSDPPIETHRRLRDAVWDMFEMEDMRRDADPRHPVDRLRLNTHIRPTHMPSLCRFDRVGFEFAPADNRSRGADTKMRAVGLTSISYFHFTAAPTGGRLEREGDSSPPSISECRRLDGKEDAFFAADDEELAKDGYFVFLNLQRTLRDGRKFPLNCVQVAETQTCGDLILSLNQEVIGSIERCHLGNGRQDCFIFWLDDWHIRVVTAGYVFPGPPFGEIVSADLSATITMSHPRPD